MSAAATSVCRGGCWRDQTDTGRGGRGSGFCCCFFLGGGGGGAYLCVFACVGEGVVSFSNCSY